MAVITDNPRPRAFDPRSMEGARPPQGPPGWDIGPERRIDDGRMLATGLAWFSIGLGMLELLAPERVGRFLGMRDRENLLRLYGVREIASGVGILAQQRHPTPWIKSRVAGDVLDLATLGLALTPRNRRRNHVLGAIGAVAGVMALDVLCHRQLTTHPA